MVVAAPQGDLQARAQQGSPWAQLNLGAAYEHGMAGLSVDAKKAIYWYEKAAQQGLGKAQFNYAHCLATGFGTERDLVAARAWMQKAAENRIADAQFLLAVMLAEGHGGPADLANARRWLSQAVAQGHRDAHDYLQALPSH
ncbi:MAG: tetratricopeptide repeat protein [Chromatiales bacterium]